MVLFFLMGENMNKTSTTLLEIAEVAAIVVGFAISLFIGVSIINWAKEKKNDATDAGVVSMDASTQISSQTNGDY